MKKSAVRLIVLLWLPVQFAFAQSGIDLQKLNRYDQFIQNEITAGNIPGAVTMVMRNGQVIKHKAFGSSDLSTNRPMEIDDLFYLQSMSKPIITTAFMMLYEEGHFLLTDPVSKYIPAFKNLRVAVDVTQGKDGETVPLETEITIAHLLSHTAGFSHGLGSSKLDEDVRNGQYIQVHPDIQSRVNNLLTLPLVGQPGKQWYYSAAPDILSVLIEQFSSMSTPDFLQKRIFTPLGMKHTGYNLPNEKPEKMVMTHVKNEKGELVKRPYQTTLTGNTIWSGVNGLYATAADYMTFCQMLLNKGQLNGVEILSRKTVELMTQNHVGDLYTGPGVGFGLGFAVVTDVAKTELLGSEGIFYWSGANNTHFFIDPKEQMISIFMTQTSPYTDFYHQKLRQYTLQSIVD